MREGHFNLSITCRCTAWHQLPESACHNQATRCSVPWRSASKGLGKASYSYGLGVGPGRAEQLRCLVRGSHRARENLGQLAGRDRGRETRHPIQSVSGPTGIRFASPIWEWAPEWDTRRLRVTARANCSGSPRRTGNGSRQVTFISPWRSCSHRCTRAPRPRLCKISSSTQKHPARGKILATLSGSWGI